MTTEPDPSDLYVPLERGDKPESIRLSTILSAIQSNPLLLQAALKALIRDEPRRGED
jgi:hypothetical protein